MTRNHLKTRYFLLPILTAAVGYMLYAAYGEVERKCITMQGFQHNLALIGVFVLVVCGLYLYFGTRAWAVVVEQRQLKKTEAAVLRSEEKFRQLADLLPQIVFEADISGRLTFANRIALKLFGYTEEAFARGVNAMEVIVPEDRDRALSYIQRTFNGEKFGGIEYRMLARDGATFPAIVYVSAIVQEGQAVGIRGSIVDLTEMRDSENALRSEEQKFRALVEESPLGVALIGPDGRYKYINPMFAELFGYDLSDIPDGRNWFQRAFPDPEYRRKVIRTWFEDLKAYKLGVSRPRTFTVTCRDGSEKLINFRPVVINTGDQILTYEDITEKSRLEAQFHQAQRMESIGTLAGGIAHDFNNLLMGIQGRTSMMLTDPVCPPSFFEHLRGVEDYVKSATDLTRRLLGFARGGKYEVRLIDLNELIQRQNLMFGRTKKEIRIVSRFQKDLRAAEADPGQIEQVILNLYVNAWQAMPGGGDLTVRTENFTVDPDRFTRPFAVNPGDYVRISVMDTGIGMDDATRRRIFEPFFTTKEMGRGTGLGLASVYGIVKNHGGFIDVFSEKGKGSTFDIYLPASRKAVQAKPAVNKRLQGIERGSGTVLLVDDEVMILTVAEQMVKRMGYTVVTAPGGKEAVELYRRRQGEIDMVILDMVMQGMGGGETFDKLKSINERVKVILSSGYSIDGQATEILNRGCNGFIQKPFNMSELSQKIKEIMAP